MLADLRTAFAQPLAKDAGLLLFAAFADLRTTFAQPLAKNAPRLSFAVLAYQEESKHSKQSRTIGNHQ